MTPRPIRAIYFDAAGTLFHLRETVGDGYSRVAQRHGFLLDPKETNTAFRRVWKTMPPMGSELGKNADRSEKSWWRQLVLQVVTEVTPAGCVDFEAFFDDLFAEYAKPELWTLAPEVVDVLDALRLRPVRLFVLSNFDSRLLPVLDGLGIAGRFEKIFYSGAIGHAKPSPEIFAHCLATAQLEPTECLHVGDDPLADWQGAKDAGWHAFELDRKRGDLRELLDLEILPDFSD